MTDQTDIENDHHQQRSVVVASACRGVEYPVVEGVVAAGPAMWSESVSVADLRLPLATGEPEQRGDRAPESGGVRWVTVTGPRVPDPQFPATTTPARQRLSDSGPLVARGGELDSHRLAGESSAGPLRWGRCPDDGCLHLLQPADVVIATTAGHAQALCGRPLPVAGLTLTHGSAGPLCTSCITGITPTSKNANPLSTIREVPGRPPVTTSPPPCGRSAINQPRGDTYHAHSTL